MTDHGPAAAAESAKNILAGLIGALLMVPSGIRSSERQIVERQESISPEAAHTPKVETDAESGERERHAYFRAREAQRTRSAQAQMSTKDALRIVLLALALAATFALVEGALLLRALRLDAGPIAAQAAITLQRTGAVIESAQDVESKLATAADTQTVYWQKTQLQVYKLVTAAKEMLVRSDHSLNDELTPRLAASLDASVGLQQGAAADLEQTTEQLRPILANLGSASAGAAAAMNNPDLVQSEKDMAVAADRLAAGTADGAATIAKIRQGVDYEVDSLLKPVRKVKVIGEEAVRLLGKFLGY